MDDDRTFLKARWSSLQASPSLRIELEYLETQHRLLGTLHHRHPLLSHPLARQSEGCWLDICDLDSRSDHEPLRQSRLLSLVTHDSHRTARILPHSHPPLRCRHPLCESTCLGVKSAGAHVSGVGVHVSDFVVRDDRHNLNREQAEAEATVSYCHSYGTIYHLSSPDHAKIREPRPL